VIDSCHGLGVGLGYGSCGQLNDGSRGCTKCVTKDFCRAFSTNSRMTTPTASLNISRKIRHARERPEGHLGRLEGHTSEQRAFPVISDR